MAPKLLLGEQTFDLADDLTLDDFENAIEHPTGISTSLGRMHLASYTSLPLADGTTISFLVSGSRPVAFIG